MGKTAFCLNLAQNAAYKTKTPIMFFSRNVPHSACNKAFVFWKRVNGNKLRTGMSDEEDW